MLKLDEIGKLFGKDLATQETINGVSIDSRTIEPGQLFFAIEGPRFDGHDFLTQAVQRGAIAAVVQKHTVSPIPTIQVNDTTQALGDLAKYYRSQFAIPVVALTGSCGKTTTKSLISHILGLQADVLSPQSSFNNHWGLPLTLLQLRAHHQYAVLEMGTNHFGEIDYLTHIAQPDIAMITNIAPVHLEGLGSKAGIAKAKAEIFHGLRADGVAILNRDEPFYEMWCKELAGHKIVSFGEHKEADICGETLSVEPNGCVRCAITVANERYEVTLSLPGTHQLCNAMAAWAVAHVLNIPSAQIAEGLATAPDVSKRLEKRRVAKNALVLNDSYNANPAAFSAALEVLSHYDGEKVVVMGDMAELGEDAIAYHQALGKEIRARGVNRLFALGKLSKATVEAYGAGGEHYEVREHLVKDLQDILHKDMTILVKASKIFRFWEIVDSLCETKNCYFSA